MGGSHGLAQRLLDHLVIAAVIEPDAIEVFRVHQVAAGVEGDIDIPVAVVVVALLHLGFHHADHGEGFAIQADRLAQSPAAGEELDFVFRSDDADVGALLVLGAIEEAALVKVSFQISW